jgi:signal transduction histidine kinase
LLEHQEEERTRLARVVHDDVGQSLIRLNMDLRWLHNRLGSRRPLLRKRTAGALKLISKAMRTADGIFTELRPAVLDLLGLAPALECATTEFERRSGIPCNFVCRPSGVRVNRRLATELFRLLQDCLKSVAFGDKATRVDVRFEKDSDCLRLTVRGNGWATTGARRTDVRLKVLMALRERVRLSGGRLTLHRAPGPGTTFCATIPL